MSQAMTPSRERSSDAAVGGVTEVDHEVEVTSEERGASLVEYALLVALIALVCVAAVTFLGNQTADSISNIGNSLN